MNSILVLAIFIFLRGIEGSILKVLQEEGGELISFCNVFFFSSMVTGIAMLLVDRRIIKKDLSRLTRKDRWILFWQGFLGYLLGPIGFYFALEHLTIIEQTLLFSLTIPLSTVAAKVVLNEQLPKQFPLALTLEIVAVSVTASTLIFIGIIFGSQSSAGLMNGDRSLSILGVIWGCFAIFSFATAGVLNRQCSIRGMGVGLTVGVGSTLSAFVFALLALSLYGPGHFITLERWWILGVIVLYAITISLGSQWSLMQSYRSLGVVQISLWSSLTIVVGLAAANFLLGESIGIWAIIGAMLILLGLLINHLRL